MIDYIARHVGYDARQVNLKGKTDEKVDALGGGRAVEVHATALQVGDQVQLLRTSSV